MAANDAGPVPDGSAEPPNDPLANQAGRVLVKNGNMGIIVPDVPAALDAITEAAEKLGGFSSSRSTSASESHGGKLSDWQPRDGHVTVRVPSSSFAELRAGIRRIAKWVEHDSENVNDVTEQFFDAKSRIGVLEAAVARFQALMDKATDANSIANLASQATRMQERLESLKGQLRRLRDQASLSTLSVSLRIPPDSPLAVPPRFWSPLRTASSAAQALGQAARSVVDAVIWLAVVGLPFVAVLGVIAWAAWGIASRTGAGASVAAAVASVAAPRGRDA